MTVSVVIPAYAPRFPILRKVLEALHQQEKPPTEILVGVDREPPEWAKAFPMVRWIRSQGPTPAAKRNRCMEEARGDILLFLDDDVIPKPGVVRAHREGHTRFPDPHIVLLGEVVWPESVRQTALGWWVEWGHVHFDYKRWQPGQQVPPYAFYAAHASGKRDFLRKAQFDEGYTWLAYEDSDYGLHLPGVCIRYWPHAQAYHEKHLTWDDIVLQARAMGRMRAYFLSRNPGRYRKLEKVFWSASPILRILQNLDPLARFFAGKPRWMGFWAQGIFRGAFWGHVADSGMCFNRRKNAHDTANSRPEVIDS